MSDQVFAFEDHLVRTVIDEVGAIWWVGRDVCAALGIANSRDALAGLSSDERRDSVGITDAIGRSRSAAIVSEPGLYRLIFASRKPAAERFKRWLAHEVLPALRRTGQYQVPAAPAVAPNFPQDAEQWLALVREARLTHGHATARRIWQDSPLPAAPMAEIANTLSASIQDFLSKFYVVTGNQKDFVRSRDLITQYLVAAPVHGWHLTGGRTLSLELKRQVPGVFAKTRGNSGYRGLRLAA